MSKRLDEYKKIKKKRELIVIASLFFWLLVLVLSCYIRNDTLCYISLFCLFASFIASIVVMIIDTKEFNRIQKEEGVSVFDLYKKNDDFEDEYLKMCEAHERWTNLIRSKSDFDEQYEAGKHYIEIAEGVIRKYKNRLEKRIISESRSTSVDYIHRRLGVFFKPYEPNKSLLDDYIQEEKRLLESYVRDNEKEAEFRQLAAQLEEIPIERNETANFHRQSIEDMPEIKTSPIGKSFDKTGKLATYVIIDLETTGLSAERDRIIQLSAIKVIEGKIMSFFNSYVNPERKIPADATKVNNITDNMVANAPRIEEIADSFVKYIGKNPIVGYNVSFDLKFLFTSGIDLISNRKIYDAYQLVKTVYKGEYSPPSYTLESICWYTGIKYPAHNSLYDCIATAFVFEKAIDEKING